MKKLLSLLLLVFSLLVSVPAHATLAYQLGGDKSWGTSELYNAYITATSLDTTASVTGKAITNLDGRIQFVTAMVNETASGGTSPTLQLILDGSNDGTNWFVVQSAQSSPAAIQTSATSISSAAVFGFDSAQFQRLGGFPPYLRLRYVLAGTSPTFTGIVSVFVKRTEGKGFSF